MEVRHEVAVLDWDVTMRVRGCDDKHMWDTVKNIDHGPIDLIKNLVVIADQYDNWFISRRILSRNCPYFMHDSRQSGERVVVEDIRTEDVIGLGERVIVEDSRVSTTLIYHVRDDVRD